MELWDYATMPRPPNSQEGLGGLWRCEELGLARGDQPAKPQAAINRIYDPPWRMVSSDSGKGYRAYSAVGAAPHIDGAG
jgi:hypothetical protein